MTDRPSTHTVPARSAETARPVHLTAIERRRSAGRHRESQTHAHG
jgi:hypothetical protein